MTYKKTLVLVFVVIVGLSSLVMLAAPAMGQEQAQTPTNEQVEQDDGPYSELLFRHSQSVSLHKVEYDDGQAHVYLTSDDGGEMVQVTASRESTGQNNRQTVELEEGKNRIVIDLHGGLRAITIDSEGRMFTHIGASQTNLAPDLPLWHLLLIIGIGAALSILVCWELIERYENLTPNRKV